MKEKIIKQCEECGKDFEQKYKNKNTRYCSLKCANKVWVKNNKEKIKISKRKNYYKNPAKALNYTIDWKKRNKSKLNNYNIKYRSNEEHKIMNLIRNATYRKYGSAKICSLCNSEIKVEHHHWKPYNVNNFIDLCKKCHHKNYHRSSE